DLRAVLDVWEGEPTIDPELLDHVALGTPHIAGYSVDGKLAGTRMMLEACCNYLGRPVPGAAASSERLPLSVDPRLQDAELLRTALAAVYPIAADDRRLRDALAVDRSGVAFDALRRNYPPRRELSAYTVCGWKKLD